MTSGRRFRTQRGSAMLIVFVFAAIVAIGLFSEMPVVIFEAQRNKEQLLVDRGNEYIQAVKLYRRKTGQYPPNLDALEKTNQIRFLRKKFVDPFTEKADWRLLHAGPNGMLIDSKIKLAQTVTGAGNSALGSFNNAGSNQSSAFGNTPGNTGFSSGFNNSGNSTFGNSSFGSSSGGSGFGNDRFANNSRGFNATTNNNGFGAQTNVQTAGGFAQPAASQNYAGSQNQNFQNGINNPAGIDPTQAQQAGPSGFVQPLPNPDGTIPTMPQSLAAPRLAVPVGTNGSATGVIDPTQPPPSTLNGQQNATGPQNPNAAAGGLIANPNPPTPQNNGFNSSSSGSAFGNNSFGNNSFGNNSFGQSSGNNGPGNNGLANNGNNNTGGFGSSSSGFGSSSSAFGASSSSNFGQLQSGGLAGVASKVARHSIKVVNDQQDYSLWEFFYDPTKDPAMNPAGAALAGAAPGSVGQPGNSPLQNGSAFGQQNGTNGQSGFGQSTFGQASGFGQQNGSSNSPFGNTGSTGFSSSGFGNTSNQPAPSAQQQQTATPPVQTPPQ